MSNKNKQRNKNDAMDGFELFTKMVKESHFYTPLDEDDKKKFIAASKKIRIQVLKRAGKYTVATVILFFLASSWKKLISTLFGKVTVIAVATTVTVSSGYYVKKVILDAPSKPDKKIETNKDAKENTHKTALADKKSDTNKPVIPFAIANHSITSETLTPQELAEIQHIFYSIIRSQKIHKDYALNVSVDSYLHNNKKYYVLDIKLNDIAKLQGMKSVNKKLASFNEVKSVCIETATTIKKSYF